MNTVYECVFNDWNQRRWKYTHSSAYRGVRKEGNQTNIFKEEDDAQWYNVGFDQVLDCYFFYTLLVESHEAWAGSGGSGDFFVFVVSEENMSHP